MVQKRPFSGNTRDLSADPDRSRVEAGVQGSLVAVPGLPVVATPRGGPDRRSSAAWPLPVTAVTRRDQSRLDPPYGMHPPTPQPHPRCAPGTNTIQTYSSRPDARGSGARNWSKSRHGSILGNTGPVKSWSCSTEAILLVPLTGPGPLTPSLSPKGGQGCGPGTISYRVSEGGERARSPCHSIARNKKMRPETVPRARSTPTFHRPGARVG